MAGRACNPLKIMEAQSRFDLNDALRLWRNEMAVSPALAADQLAELEAHLRDSSQALASKGLPLEEAFWLARRRLGGTDQVGREYAKLNPEAVWLDRVLWMVAGVLLLQTVSALASAVSNLTLALAAQSTLAPNALGALRTAVFWLALLPLIWWLWRHVRDHDETVLHVQRWVRAHPYGAGLTMMAVPALVSAVHMLPQVWLSRTLTPALFGHLAIWSSASSLALSTLFWPCVVTWLLVRAARRPAVA